MKIANRITFYFLCLGIFLTIIAISTFYIISKNSLQKEIYAQLKTIVEAKAQHVETYLEMLKVSIAQFSKSVVLEDFLLALKENPGVNKAAFEIAMRRLERTKEANPEIYEYLLLDTTGKVVASSNKNSIGQEKAADDFFIGGKTGLYIKDAYYSEELKEQFITVAAPFLNSKTNEFIGVLGARVKLNGLDKITVVAASARKTGEVYIVNRNGYMITPSRFLKDTFLKEKVDSLNYRACLEHPKEREKGSLEKDIVVSLGYRGVKVLGAHAYIPEMQWCILAEIDQDEAFAPLFQIKILFFSLLFAVPLAVLLLGSFIARIITEPIHKLHKGTEMIGAGNLEYRVGTNAKDEIGQLSRAFDSMTENLKMTTTSVDNLNKEISERKKIEAALRESERKFRAIFDQTFQFIGLMTLDGILIEANRAALELSGIKESEVLGKPFWETPWWRHSAELQAKLREAIKAAASGQFVRFEATHLDAQGSTHYVDFSLKPVKDEIGKVTMLIPEGRDITEKKEAENQMKKAITIKEEFTAMVSHELRTPLGPIKEGVRIILDGLTGVINQEQRDLLSTVERSADRLNRLINNVLDFQKLQAGKMPFNLQENDIAEVVSEVHKTMSLLTKARGLSFALECDLDLPKIIFDRDKIIQVLTNLVNNAIKFTEQGGIKIIAKKEENIIHIIVQDTGPGINSEDFPRLFQSFQQLGLAKEKGLGGTGLGLAISKEIILQHNGRIWVESEPGKGTSFQFVLPIKERRA